LIQFSIYKAKLARVRDFGLRENVRHRMISLHYTAFALPSTIRPAAFAGPISS
jgi:hypothetical protein